jgi:hypothetical protein
VCPWWTTKQTNFRALGLAFGVALIPAAIEYVIPIYAFAVASAAFSTDNNPPDAIRLCFGGPISRDDWEEGLHHVADLIEQPAYLSSMVR